MVKITYDENDKIQCKQIEDYYWLKYYLKSFTFDWCKFTNGNKTSRCKIDDGYEKIVFDNINKSEFNYFLEIMKELDIWYLKADYPLEIIYSLLTRQLTQHKIIETYKENLVYRYGDKK
jgi:hypothetical protein